MKELIFVVVAALVVGLGAAAEQLGLPVPLKGRRYRALAMLAIFPIALLCALAVSYSYTAFPSWAVLLSAPLVVALCAVAAIYLVGRILPDKINDREGERR